MAKRQVNYLNNKDILREIHRSKTSYCSFTDPAFSMYDIIIEKIDDLTDEKINEAITARHTRLTKDALENQLGDSVEIPLPTAQEVVIRLMTTEHIPLVPKRKTRKNTDEQKKSTLYDDFLDDDSDIDDTLNTELPDDVEMVPMRVNFPAFQHLMLDDNRNPIVVGKSHWCGDVHSGEFCKNKGSITNELAKMFLKFCERYASKRNWRSYTYNDEMQGAALLHLVKIGLQFNEARGSNPFAYYTTTTSNSFKGVLNVEKKIQSHRDDVLESAGLAPSWTRQTENDMMIQMKKYDLDK